MDRREWAKRSMHYGYLNEYLGSNVSAASWLVCYQALSLSFNKRKKDLHIQTRIQKKRKLRDNVSR